jgi:uncharacterized LabA/DUF88 family protein
LHRFLALLQKNLLQSYEVPKGTPLLRIYWYDAQIDGKKTMAQQEVAYTPNVKLRLGSVNSFGAQKGVDSLLIVDLLTLVHNKAITDAAIVTGDADMVSAMTAAQDNGVRVHLVVLPTPNHGFSCSHTLIEEADSTILMAHEDVIHSFSRNRLHMPKNDLVDFRSAEALLQVSVYTRTVDAYLKLMQTEGVDLHTLANADRDSDSAKGHRKLLLGVSKNFFGRSLTPNEIDTLDAELASRLAMLQDAV